MNGGFSCLACSALHAAHAAVLCTDSILARRFCFGKRSWGGLRYARVACSDHAGMGTTLLAVFLFLKNLACDRLSFEILLILSIQPAALLLFFSNDISHKCCSLEVGNNVAAIFVLRCCSVCLWWASLFFLPFRMLSKCLSN